MKQLQDTSIVHALRSYLKSSSLGRSWRQPRLVEALTIVFAVLAALIIPYLIISIILAVFGRKVKLKKDYATRFDVSIFLPTYNEELFVERKLNNLLEQTYPIHEILVYDCSEDRTPLILKEYQTKYPMIRIIRQETRIGMARTLNQALIDSTGDLVVKTDCDSIVKSKSALAELVANFGDPNVGGATGICLSPSGVEKHFRKIMRIIQIAETNIDSTVIAHGPSLLAFRKKAVVEINPDSMADDTEEFVLIRKGGFRTVVDPSVVSEEDVPDKFSARRMQKDRRAQGIINVLLQNASLIRNRKYGQFGSVVLPMEIFILVLSPFFLLSLSALAVVVLYVIHPLLALAALAVVAASAITKSNVIWAVIDTQLSGLVGTLKSVAKKNQPLWARVR